MVVFHTGFDKESFRMAFSPFVNNGRHRNTYEQLLGTALTRSCSSLASTRLRPCNGMASTACALSFAQPQLMNEVVAHCSHWVVLHPSLCESFVYLNSQPKKRIMYKECGSALFVFFHSKSSVSFSKVIKAAFS